MATIDMDARLDAIEQRMTAAAAESAAIDARIERLERLHALERQIETLLAQLTACQNDERGAVLSGRLMSALDEHQRVLNKLNGREEHEEETN